MFNLNSFIDVSVVYLSMLTSSSYEVKKSEVLKLKLDEVTAPAEDFPWETPSESSSSPFPSICKSRQEAERHKPPMPPFRAFMDDLMTISVPVQLASPKALGSSSAGHGHSSSE